MRNRRKGPTYESRAMKRIMRPETIIPALSLVAALSLAAPAVASASPVQITSFTASPSCVRPGGSVSASATVQDTTPIVQTFYSHWTVSEGAYQVYNGTTGGPYTVPPLASISQSQNTQIPWYTPWGRYTVTLTIGPSSTDTSSWSRLSAPLTVSPYC